MKNIQTGNDTLNCSYSKWLLPTSTDVERGHKHWLTSSVDRGPIDSSYGSFESTYRNYLTAPLIVKLSVIISGQRPFK